MLKNSTLLLFLSLGLLSCKKSETRDCDDAISLYSNSSFPIGVAIESYDMLDGTRNKEIIDRQFNSFTPENIFKPNSLHPEENTFNWPEADQMLDYALSQNKRFHGHTLLWHNQLPLWMENFQGNSAEWEAMLKTHIQTICHHFKGKVKAWDVLNEAFNEDGSLRNSIWKQHIGASYIEKAFVFAHEADPEAILFYNDFNLALNDKKRDAVVSLIRNLKQRNIPIHGIGLQMHISIYYPSNVVIASAMKEFYQLGLKVHLSELDISLNPRGLDIELTDKLLQKQAQKMYSVSLLYQQIPKAYQYGITFWGHSDVHSWIPSFFGREDYPLLFDANYKAKPMYCKFLESL